MGAYARINGSHDFKNKHRDNAVMLFFLRIVHSERSEQQTASIPIATNASFLISSGAPRTAFDFDDICGDARQDCKWRADYQRRYYVV